MLIRKGQGFFDPKEKWFVYSESDDIVSLCTTTDFHFRINEPSGLRTLATPRDDEALLKQTFW